MDRRRFLKGSAASVGVAAHPLDTAWASPSAQPAPLSRALVVYVDNRLPGRDEILRRVHSSQATSALLQALSAGLPIQTYDGVLSEPVDTRLALNHVLLIGRSDDPLLELAWQREALVSGDSLYAFGFGNVRGSVGYLESDRNPFLHSANIAKAPYECQCITITGTDASGINVALSALLEHGLVNGMVAEPGRWTRGPKTLLERDPLPLSFTLPDVLPATLGPLKRIAVTQATEDEYRGVLADAGVEPVMIWRAKYYAPGEWDGAGELAAFRNYSVGLHRRAYGNTVWVADLSSPTAAASAAPRIAAAAHLAPDGKRWHGTMPAYSWPLEGLGDAAVTGTLELRAEGSSVIMEARTSPVPVISAGIVTPG